MRSTSIITLGNLHWKKEKVECFPISKERFVDGRDLKSDEIDNLVKAALMALDSNDHLMFDDVRFTCKF